MKTTRLLTIALLMWVMPFVAHADSWGPIKQTEFFSENRKHMLKIDPHPDWPSMPGHCHATLFREGREAWSRCLINNHAPVRVFVSNSGEYVITMDEWHSIGELPVVIYGHLGELVRAHSTDSLGLKADIQHIKITISSYWWNEDSVSFFGPDDKKFLIRLHWGKWIILDLGRGDLFQKEEVFFRDDLRKQHEQEWSELEQYRQQTLARRAIRMLESKEPEERKTGAMICGQEKLTEAIPALRDLLYDNASFGTNVPKEWTRVYFVRKAAMQALEALGQPVEGITIEEPEEM